MSDLGSIDDYIPSLGRACNAMDIVVICEAVKKRQEKFPDETLEDSFTLILRYLGDRFQPLRCEGKEWRGYKKDLVAYEPGTTPTCPNGHELIKERGVTLGWVMGRED